MKLDEFEVDKKFDWRSKLNNRFIIVFKSTWIRLFLRIKLMYLPSFFKIDSIIFGTDTKINNSLCFTKLI